MIYEKNTKHSSMSVIKFRRYQSKRYYITSCTVDCNEDSNIDLRIGLMRQHILNIIRQTNIGIVCCFMTSVNIETINIISALIKNATNPQPWGLLSYGLDLNLDLALIWILVWVWFLVFSFYIDLVINGVHNDVLLNHGSDTYRKIF